MDAQADALIAQTDDADIAIRGIVLLGLAQRDGAEFLEFRRRRLRVFGSAKRFAAKAAVDAARKCLRVSILVVSLLKVLARASRVQGDQAFEHA